MLAPEGDIFQQIDEFSAKEEKHVVLQKKEIDGEEPKDQDGKPESDCIGHGGDPDDPDGGGPVGSGRCGTALAQGDRGS
jgi:hypothetical protein